MFKWLIFIHIKLQGANILVDNKGCIKLADFGASKQVVELVRALSFTLHLILSYNFISFSFSSPPFQQNSSIIALVHLTDMRCVL